MGTSSIVHIAKAKRLTLGCVKFNVEKSIEGQVVGKLEQGQRDDAVVQRKLRVEAINLEHRFIAATVGPTTKEKPTITHYVFHF